MGVLSTVRKVLYFMVHKSVTLENFKKKVQIGIWQNETVNAAELLWLQNTDLYNKGNP